MKRVKGTQYTVPVVHGSVAIYLGDKGTESRSHKWTVYLRPLEPNVELSYFIRHVEFVLHDSFDNHVRKVADMPYECHEYGWGEFEIVIRVHFQDTSEKVVEFFHPLRLFESGGKPSPTPVVTEFFDEIVFQDPSEKLHHLLKTTPHGPEVRLRLSSFAQYYKDFTNVESNDLKKIDEARKKLREESIKRQARYEELETERATLVREINSRGGRAS